METPIQFPDKNCLGVIGAGTMGSGISLAILTAGLGVTLYDVSPEMLEKARQYITKHLERKGLQAYLNNLTLTSELQIMRQAGVVIEAIPEDLALKQTLFSRLDDICPPPAVLATNTSTLAVTAIASAACHPERVVGLHFFNPAPLMPLVEVVRGALTSAETIEAMVSLVGQMEKTPVVAHDLPGFIVNRVARPFYGEALRLLGEGTATHAEIDRLARQGAGFRMGPFQLMDLIGIDINLAAMQSMYEQTFGEPRYRPHPIQVQMVQQKALGRKSGHGYYEYDAAQPGAFDDPPPPQAPRLAGRLVFSSGSWAPGLAELCQQTGYEVLEFGGPGGGAPPDLLNGAPPLLAVVSRGVSEELAPRLTALERILPLGTPILCQCVDVTLAELATWVQHPERLVGFDGLFFTASAGAASLVADPALEDGLRQRVEDFVHSLGRGAVWVQDGPGLVLPRIVGMLCNEAAFAAGDGVAEVETIDKAMQLGASYPKGPLTWGAELGYGRVVAVLEHLQREYGEDRYRVAPLLRRWARWEKRPSPPAPLHMRGEGGERRRE